jgi:hypothetical protein
VFGQQQRGDQEAAEHEEDVDADEATGDAGEAAVVSKHQRDGQRTDAVQGGQLSPGLSGELSAVPRCATGHRVRDGCMDSGTS